MTQTPDFLDFTVPREPDRSTDAAHIERTIHGLRTRNGGHLARAIELIEALRAERDRRRTALNVLGLVVSLLLESDQAAPPTRAMDPMRRALLESALERAVLALYPEPREETHDALRVVQDPAPS